MTEQWNPETTDRGWHWLRRRDNLEWRLAFRDRVGAAGTSRMSSAVRPQCHLARSVASSRTTARCDGMTNQRTSKTMPKTEAELLELMRADRLVLSKSQAEQRVVDREAAGEVVPAVRIERVPRRRRIKAAGD